MYAARHPILIFATIVTIVYGLVFSLPERPLRQLDDKALRAWALDVGLRPIPDSLAAVSTLLGTANNRLTPEKIALGKALFNDPILSKDDTISCASCHILDAGGDDNLPTERVNLKWTVNSKITSICQPDSLRLSTLGSSRGQQSVPLHR